MIADQKVRWPDRGRGTGERQHIAWKRKGTAAGRAFWEQNERFNITAFSGIRRRPFCPRRCPCLKVPD